MRINRSPSNILLPMLDCSLDKTSNVAPLMPAMSPAIFNNVIFSDRKANPNSRIKTGVAKINNAPCIGVVNVSPLINMSWFTATPVNAQSKKRPISFLSMPALDGFKLYSNQNKAAATLTRIRFKPNGLMSDGEMYLTILKLTPNNKLVNSTAQCALMVCCFDNCNV